MRKIVVLIVAISVILLLPACGSKITEGEVVDKNFSPAHTMVVIMPIVVSNGKTATTTYVPFTYYYPDTYTITIAAIEGEEKQTATFRVRKEVYENTPIGAEFIYDKDMEPSEPEYVRERTKEDE